MMRCVLILAAILAATAAHAYDDTWHEDTFWSGEYPTGFSVSAETSIPMRAEPDPDAPAALTCVLSKGATYHPWNHARVADDALVFRSYSKKHTYTIKRAYTATLSAYRGDDEKVRFKPGDTWTYLAYLAEGMFLMERGGKLYVGGQDLFEASETTGAPELVSDEWLNLPCANGTRGWLLVREVLGQPGIREANITGYPEAQDLSE